MKSAVIVAFLLCATYASADHVDTYLENSKDEYTSCAKQYGIAGNTPREIFDNDAKTGVDGATCLRSCSLQKLGVIKDSKLSQDKANDFLQKVHSGNPEMIQTSQKAAADCIEKVKSVTDDCKMAYSFTECFLSKH